MEAKMKAKSKNTRTGKAQKTIISEIKTKH